MPKKSYAGCLGLYPATSSQFTVEMCAAAKNCEKIHENCFLEGLRLFKITVVDKSKKHVTSACFQQVCIYLQPFLHYKSQ